ncbi:hypothetical protein M758_9G036100 [Ceratodon purpureus]|nr:hypothetical protein M758_9G036100 [Ceratodon purpureus]
MGLRKRRAVTVVDDVVDRGKRKRTSDVLPEKWRKFGSLLKHALLKLCDCKYSVAYCVPDVWSVQGGVPQADPYSQGKLEQTQSKASQRKSKDKIRALVGKFQRVGRRRKSKHNVSRSRSRRFSTEHEHKVHGISTKESEMDQGSVSPALNDTPLVDLMGDLVILGEDEVSDEIQEMPIVNPTPELEIGSRVENLSPKYVILNHSPDVDKDFVSALERNFLGAGLQPFMNAKSFVRERHAYNFDDERFSRVQLHVAIFSKGFAESKYCLNELSDMVRSKKQLVTIFYDIEPEQLHSSEGPFNAAFHGFLNKGKEADVRRWNETLQAIDITKGFMHAEVDKLVVAKLVENIVDSTSNVPHFTIPNQLIRHPTHPKGLSSHVISHPKTQQLEDLLQNLTLRTMGSLGIHQKPTRIEHGGNQLVQRFQGNANGIVVGRFDTSTMQIQFVLVDLKTMINITGVGLDLKVDMTRVGLEPTNLILVTIGSDDLPTEVTMTKIEKEKCNELNQVGDAFYALHLDEDVQGNRNDSTGHSLSQGVGIPTSSSFKSETSLTIGLEDPEGTETGQDQYSTCEAYRVHVVAKLLLLMRCGESGDKSFWSKIVDLASIWHWQDIFEIAMVHGGVGGTFNGDGGGNVNGGGRGNVNGGGGGRNSDGNGGGGNNDGANGGGANGGGANGGGANGGGGGGADDGGEKRGPYRGISSRKLSSSDTREIKSYSIRIKPGYDTFCVLKDQKLWPYKKIHIYATPYIIVTFRKPSVNDVISEREIHVETGVNFDLANGSEPSQNEKHQFAWYHDSFEFSFQSKIENAAELVPDSGKVHKVKDAKSTSGRCSTSTSEQWTAKGKIEGKFGLPGAEVRTSGSLARAGEGSTLAHEETRELVTKQTESGFGFAQAFSDGPKPSIGCKFSYSIAPRVLFHGRGMINESFYTHPVCSSTTEVIEGAFKPLLDEEEYYLYAFRCERTIKGLFWKAPAPTASSPRSKGIMKRISYGCMSLGPDILESVWEEKTCHQEFRVRIYINHAMKHIRRLSDKFSSRIPPLAPSLVNETPCYRKVIKTERTISADRLPPYDGHARQSEAESSDNNLYF